MLKYILISMMHSFFKSFIITLSYLIVKKESEKIRWKQIWNILEHFIFLLQCIYWLQSFWHHAHLTTCRILTKPFSGTGKKKMPKNTDSCLGIHSDSFRRYCNINRPSQALYCAYLFLSYGKLNKINISIKEYF